MNKFAKMIAVCGLFLGGLMFAAPAMAQGDAANTNKEKTVSKTEVVSTPAVKTCNGSATKACCASKGSANASGGEMKVTNASAGSNGKACCASKGSASASTGGEMKVTNASAGSNGTPACTKAASTSSCSGSKAMGGNVSETSGNAGSSTKTTKACKNNSKACCASKKAEAVQ